MSALSDFIEVMQWQRESLEDASGRDDWALELVERGDERERKPGQRKVWTRQDVNRFESECDWQENKNNPPAIPCVLGLSQEHRTRQRTRIEWILRRVTKPANSLDRYRLLAMADAQQQGTYFAVAPLLIDATEKHLHLIAVYGDSDEFAQDEDWNSVIKDHDEAVRQLGMHVDTPETQGKHKQNTNSSAKTTSLRTPKNAQECSLFMLLYANAQKDKQSRISDAKVARGFVPANELKGKTLLAILVTRRSRDEISNWR